MRLIQIDDPLGKTLSWQKTLSLVERVGNEIPSYLILSHTWGDDKDEVTFKDMRKGRGRDKYGYDKIRFCLKQALDHGLQYFGWIPVASTSLAVLSYLKLSIRCTVGTKTPPSV
tara:strand:- start:1430 stop:1771 length:342 start_codon:yes stop_codon:yes gene_type:complete